MSQVSRISLIAESATARVLGAAMLLAGLWLAVLWGVAIP
jgi:hypothetical protein